jgi:hypothetical protein
MLIPKVNPNMNLITKTYVKVSTYACRITAINVKNMLITKDRFLPTESQYNASTSKPTVTPAK